MLGKRRPIVKFFDLFTNNPTDPEFGIFLVEVANLVRQRKVVQLLIRENIVYTKLYKEDRIECRLNSFLENLRLSHEKFSVAPTCKDIILFGYYTVSLKRKFLGLFWI